MAGLPKKYAKMGFKKGWRAYKASKRKTSYSAPVRRKKVTKSRTRTMPKKRKTTRRAKTQSVFGINLGTAGSAALYGALRAKMSGYLAPYTEKIPAGAVSDEVGMVVATQLLKKMVFKRAGLARNALNAGQQIEFARIGEAIAMGQVNLGLNSAPASSNNGNLF